MLRFQPHYKQVVWGGARLQSLFDDPKAIPTTGEIWTLGDVAGFDPRAAGQDDGPTLSERWHAGELGGSGVGQFPLLIKWLDTSAPLSVQVHPDEALGRELGGHSKHEAWYFLEPDRECAHADAGTVWAGWSQTPTRAALLDEANAGTLPARMKTWEPQAGDIIDLKPRTFHALGPGLTLLEVQQPSDTTYRVYDWGRVGMDGKPRQLHLDNSARCLRQNEDEGLELTRAPLQTPYFKLEDLEAGAAWSPPQKALRIVIALGASKATVAETECALRPGECWVLEAKDMGDITLESGRLLGVHVPLGE